MNVRERSHPLHPYVSDTALAAQRSLPDGGWTEIDGTLAFFDVSGFTKLTERLAALGRSGAEHINDVLNTVFRGLIDEVFRAGGDVLEFGGDAMVVLFTGEQHERRAAIAATQMLRFMSVDGRIETPAGVARLRVSCGMASGTQPYHLLGVTRRALMVAGPVSTEMARLEAAASAGEVFINERLAAALPTSWVGKAGDGATSKLRLGSVAVGNAPIPEAGRSPADAADVVRLLPTQFSSLVDAGHRAGELKQVAMAFVRLNGTDDLLDSYGVDETHRVLREVTEIVDRAATELDVCWLETQAEANSVRWTLVSGASTATEHDGERLLRVVRRIAERSPRPLRIGANLGVVFVGDMGHPDRCTFIVMGDTTNLAARLMAKALPAEIIAGERLHDTCLGRFATIPLVPFLVKGKRAMVRAFQIGAVVDGDHDLDDGGVDEQSMVGRRDELATLSNTLTGTDVIDVVGEAGSGKTRLWRQARLGDNDRKWLVVRAEPQEADSPYLTFRRLIRIVAGVSDGDDAQRAGVTLTSFVRQTEPELKPWIPLIADVAGVLVASTDEVEALDAAFRTERLRSATAELIAASLGPDTVIVIEDAQWLDDASRGVLDTLSLLPERTFAMIVTRRSSEWEPTDGLRIPLGPIDDADADELLLRELPAHVASDATLARLRDAGAGNPLYLIELARAQSAASMTDVIPDSIERLLAARIDQLSVSGRELIRDASVLGSTINRDVASRVLGRPDLIDVDTWRRELGDLMVVDGESVRFEQDLVRVAAYEGLSMRRRRALHRRAGDVLEEWGDAAPVPDVVGALAFHASGAAIPERIVRWNGQAAEMAINKGAMEIAEQLLDDVVRAQRQLDSSPADRSASSRRLAFAAEHAGHPDVALAALGDAMIGAEERERALIAIDRARVQEKLGNYRAALATTARALKACPDPEVAAHLLLARATLKNFQGRWRECLELCARILDDTDRLGDKRVVAQAHLLAEWCCTSLGLPERAEHARLAEDLLKELDDSIGLANLYLNRGEGAWRENRTADSIDDFRSSSQRYVRAGDVVGAALADNNLAELLTLQFHLDEADDLLRRARRVTTAANYPHGTFTIISGLSRIEAWRGRTVEARELQLEALQGFRDLNAEDFAVDSLVRLVEIDVLAGDPSAITVADEAADALRRLGDMPVLPATLARLRARALLLVGRVDDARESFERAFALATVDGFAYEIALATMGLARINDDGELLAAAVSDLERIGVSSPPPGS